MGEEQTFQVAFIDMGLFGMPGDRVRNALKEINPHLVTILMTGWEAQHQGDRAEAFDLTIQKPFQMPDIRGLLTKTWRSGTNGLKPDRSVVGR